VQARTEQGRSALALIGLRCSGKSTLARAIARELGARCVDLDLDVLEAARAAGIAGGASAPGELLQALGEPRFRELESAALEKALQADVPVVITTGGGVVEREANRERLAARALCVWLRADLETLKTRLRADPAPRPALGGGAAADELETLARRREAWYASLAKLELDTTASPPHVLAARLLAALDPAARPQFRLLGG
jgi:shikimate kinase